MACKKMSLAEWMNLILPNLQQMSEAKLVVDHLQVRRQLGQLAMKFYVGLAGFLRITCAKPIRLDVLAVKNFPFYCRI